MNIENFSPVINSDGSGVVLVEIPHANALHLMLTGEEGLQYMNYFDDYNCNWLTIHSYFPEAYDIDFKLISKNNNLVSLVFRIPKGCHINYGEAKRFKNLTLLGIDNAVPEGFPGFENFPKLETLSLNYVKNIKINHVSHLRRLLLENYSEIDLMPLVGLNNLYELLINKSKITNLNDLKYFPNLTELHLFSASKLEDISGLKHLKKLKELTIKGVRNKIDFSVLKECPELTVLEIGKVDDIDFIKDCKNISSFTYTKSKK